MAKDDAGPAKLTMVAKPAARPYAPPPKGKQPLPDSNIRRMTPDEVVASIRDFAAGWSEEARKALSVSSELSYARNDMAGTVLFSREKEFGITHTIASMEQGRLARPSTEYAIAFYSKPMTEYIVLVDMGRRIIVRELVVNFHDKPAKKDWAGVVKAIRAAESAAAQNPGRIAVYDGALTLL
jgi:hypothetical protein